MQRVSLPALRSGWADLPAPRDTTQSPRPKEWEKYEPAAAKLVSIKTQRFANYVGQDKSERLLARKVCVSV